ncbi:MAG: replicative DNA helicase [Acidobacteria bacterium]|nr:replicative DNA helicase [Acidobacteriota bacterium]MCB9396967.1 replicative DNA helicase [Acidobacteriota bacterium]
MSTALETKSLPHNDEAERVLLGAMLLDRSKVSDVLGRVRQEEFYRKNHQVIYTAILRLFEKDEAVDPLLVADELERNGEFHEAGGYEYLNELTQGIPKMANVEYYATIVKQKSLLRQLAQLGQKISMAAVSGEVEPENVVSEAEAALSGLHDSGDRHDFQVFSNVLEETFHLIQERSQVKGNMIGIPTGFMDFDKMTSGMQKGDLVIVAARPAMGKTSFCMNLAIHAALRGQARVAVFSLEMPAAQLAMRLVGSEARLGISELRSGRLQQDEWQVLADAVGRLSSAQIYIDDAGDLNVFQMRAKLKKLQKDRGLDMVIIDYLQLMSGSSLTASQNRTQEVSEISRGLKVMAKELGVPVIALSQLSRAAEHRSDHRPQLADLRESGSIEQDADMVCFLFREDYYKRKKEGEVGSEADSGDPDVGISELIIAKHRNGPTGTVKLLFFKKYTRFENCDGWDSP